MNWVEWLIAQRHRARKGHMPVWYEMGPGFERQCVNCLKGGHRQRSRPLLPRLQPALHW